MAGSIRRGRQTCRADRGPATRASEGTNGEVCDRKHAVLSKEPSLCRFFFVVARKRPAVASLQLTTYPWRIIRVRISGDRKSPRPGVVLDPFHPWPFYGLSKWGWSWLLLTYLEPEISTLKWLFQLDDSKSLHEEWLFHQTSIKKWLFGVPGTYPPTGIPSSWGTLVRILNSSSPGRRFFDASFVQESSRVAFKQHAQRGREAMMRSIRAKFGILFFCLGLVV